VIPLERRRRSGLQDPLLRQIVEIRRRHARRDAGGELGQHFTDQPARLAHALELGGGPADNHRGAP